jgi:hypothetical protein
MPATAQLHNLAVAFGAVTSRRHDDFILGWMGETDE